MATRRNLYLSFLKQITYQIDSSLQVIDNLQINSINLRQAQNKLTIKPELTTSIESLVKLNLNLTGDLTKAHNQLSSAQISRSQNFNVSVLALKELDHLKDQITQSQPETTETNFVLLSEIFKTKVPPSNYKHLLAELKISYYDDLTPEGNSSKNNEPLEDEQIYQIKQSCLYYSFYLVHGFLDIYLSLFSLLHLTDGIINKQLRQPLILSWLDRSILAERDLNQLPIWSKLYLSFRAKNPKFKQCLLGQDLKTVNPDYEKIIRIPTKYVRILINLNLLRSLVERN